MTPVGLGAVRKAAALTHAVSSLGVMVGHGDELRAIVCAHRMDVHPSVRQFHPCEFRQSVAWALGEQRAGRPVGVSGLPVGVDPTLRLFALTDCDVRDDGLVRCLTDEAEVVLLFATLLDVAAVHLAGESCGLRSVEDGRSGVALEYCRDGDLDVTLVYHRRRLIDAGPEAHAVDVLVSMAATAGVEEITSPDHPYLAAR